MNEDIRNLDNAIANSAPVSDERVVWRLADSPLLHAHAPRLAGCVLRDLGFLDTTFDEGVARGYVSGAHPVLVRITVPPGTRVLPMFQVIDSQEGDLLMARGTRFRVTGVQPTQPGAALRLDLEIVP